MKKLKLFFIVFIFSFTSVNASTEALVDFSGASIEEIQEYVEGGLLNYETITQIYLERIEKYNDDYKAIININENVIEEAKALDKEFKEKGRRSLIHGIPVLVKDNIDVEGLPTTAGAKGLSKNIALEDAKIIKNLKEQGALIIAKANMDEFAFHAIVSYSSYGIVANAYDLSISSYGSSGGTAAGIAADMAVVGIGTDTGTSIRIPSAANNLYGLRPTQNSLSSDGMIHFESLRDTSGPMAKHAKDAALLYHLMKDGEDSFEPQEISDLKIGVITSKMKESSPFIRKLVNEKIEILKELGVSFVELPALSLQYEFDANNLCYEFNEYIKGTQGPIQSLQDLINTKEYVSYIDAYVNEHCASNYQDTNKFKSYLKVRENNIQIANQYFKKHDVDAILYPNLNTKLHKKDVSLAARVGIYASIVAPQTGFPSINIPAGFHEGLPYGVEILAPKDQDDLLLSLAIMLDEVDPTYRLPSISPTLYEPIPEIERLMEITQENRSKQEHIKVQKNIEYFLENYGNLHHRQKTAQRLIEIYDSTDDYLQKQRVYEEKLLALKDKIIFASIAEVGLLIFYIVIRKRNNAKRK